VLDRRSPGGRRITMTMQERTLGHKGLEALVGRSEVIV
jgi:hypothetical protein